MKNTEKAFQWITNILEQQKIRYKICGGFAAQIHGVTRTLADIDIEIIKADIEEIAQITKEYTIFGPAQYKDENWDLKLLTLLYEGQQIDISSSEGKIYNLKSRAWEDFSINLDNANIVEVFGKKVPIETIDSLIEYKTKLGREVDIEDTQQLLSRETFEEK